MEISKVDFKGLPRNQQGVIPTDGAPGVNNALFSEQDSIDPNLKSYANCFITGASGNITLVLFDGRVVLMPGMVAGIWHCTAPFSQVLATGTVTNYLLVGVTSTRYNVGA